jgi:hypothetical protein
MRRNIEFVEEGQSIFGVKKEFGSDVVLQVQLCKIIEEGGNLAPYLSAAVQRPLYDINHIFRQHQISTCHVEALSSISVRFIGVAFSDNSLPSAIAPHLPIS